MALTPAMRGILTAVAEGVVDGSISYETDYGTFDMRNMLRYNASPEGEEVRQFLDATVQRLNGGSHAVVFVDRDYVGQCPMTGLTLAYVPAGEDNQSSAAKYFVVAGGSNSVYWLERASADEVARSLQQRRASDRRRAYEQTGKTLAGELVEQVRQFVRRVMHEASLSDEQREDILNISGGGSDWQSLPTRIEGMKLSKLYAILVVAGRPELPRYQS